MLYLNLKFDFFLLFCNLFLHTGIILSVFFLLQVFIMLFICLFQSASDSEIEYSPFDYKYQSPALPSADLSDEESSGISSNDNDLDNVIKGSILIYFKVMISFDYLFLKLQRHHCQPAN